MRPVCRHGILAGNGAQGNGVLIGALVTHHAHGTDRAKQDGARLPHMVVKRRAIGHGVIVHMLNVNVIGILQDAYLLTSDVAQYAHGQAWSREGMALDKPFRHLQLVAHTAHLVLEEPLQGLAKLQVHLLGQSAHVVMALDDHARNAETLNAVWIDSALSQPLGIGNLLGLGVEHLHEITANNLAFLLWVAHALQVLEELVASVHAYHVESQSLVSLHYLLELVLAQHAMVYENTREIAANSLVEQGGAHR